LSVISLFAGLKDIQRLSHIVAVLAKYGFGNLVRRLGLEESKLISHLLPAEPPPGSEPERLRRVLEELGPTFVKFGQILSTRADLIPPAYAREFSKLQDEVEPVSLAEVAQQIRLELGEEIGNVFKEFDPLPVASASLAQVHRAALKDGTVVAVKVQRPGIKSVIETDIDLLYLLARLATKSIPELRFYSPTKIVREFERVLMKELDFTVEAANSERFRRNFHNNPHANFPRVFHELSGKKVLTMEYVDGVKITDARAAGYDPCEIARLGLHIVIDMIFRDGFFHADPHPGNVLVTEGPTINFLDLGEAGRVSEEVREKILLLMLALGREDFEEVVSILLRIGLQEEEVDVAEFRKDVLDVCDRHFGKQLRHLEFKGFIHDIIEGAFRHKIRIPYDYLLVIKALITMEGVGKELDPDINVFEEGYDHFVELFKSRYSLARLSKDVTKAVIALSSTVQEAPLKLRSLLDSIEQGSLKLRIEDTSARARARAWERVLNRFVILGLMAIVLAASFVLLLATESWLGWLMGAVGLLFATVLGLTVAFSVLRSGDDY